MELAEKIARFAVAVPRQRLHPTVVAELDASAARKEKWLVAFSGGADSLALLILVSAHWPAQKSRLIAAHFNHALRGGESDADEKFCREFCDQIGVSLQIGRWLDGPTRASEDEARKARFAFFEQLAGIENISVLLTGHQANDVLETQLMRLARGSGSAGLAAPRPKRSWLSREVILRPLLSLSAHDIREELRAAGLSWREDSSNQGTEYFRNRIRQDVVLPWLQHESTRVLNGSSLTRTLLEEDDDALNQWLDRFQIDFASQSLDLAVLQTMPRGLLRRALRRWCIVQELDRTAFEELLNIVGAGFGRMSLGLGLVSVNSGELAYSESKSGSEIWSPAQLMEGCELFLPSGGRLVGQRVDVCEGQARAKAVGQNSQNHSVMLCERLPLSVRSWQPGDRYQPLGNRGTAKLQDLFVNRKIPAEQRRHLPVVLRADGCIVWVPGFPPSERSKLSAQSVTAVQLTYTSGTSTVRNQS